MNDSDDEATPFLGLAALGMLKELQQSSTLSLTGAGAEDWLDRCDELVALAFPTRSMPS